MSRDSLLSVHEDEGGFDAAHCCACCRADTSYGDHDAGCANETMDLEHVEALAASAEQDPFANMQPLGGPRETPAVGLILASPAARMGPGRTFSVGGGQ